MADRPALPASAITIAADVTVPQVGFGLYKVPAESAHALAGLAIAEGYRHLDTASFYGNEAGVGRAVRDAAERGIARDQLFVTSKVWNDDHGHDATLRAFDTSMRHLGLEQLDLYLIHWPVAERGLFVQTWRALEQLLADGRVRAIGVSNFQPAHLRQLLDHADHVPAVNQIELHPWLQQHTLRALHDELGIVTEAWSPLGRGALLSDPAMMRLAADLGMSVARLIVRWHLQLGHVVIPKTSTRDRMRENADVFDLELSDETMRTIAGLDRGRRTGSHPDQVS